MSAFEIENNYAMGRGREFGRKFTIGAYKGHGVLYPMTNRSLQNREKEKENDGGM